MEAYCQGTWFITTTEFRYVDISNFVPTGVNIFHFSIVMAFHTLYWSIYGYSPPAFADVVTSEHHIRVGNQTQMVVNDHHFTAVVGHTMFALYYIVGIIVMINMLIAMLSTSFSTVQVNSLNMWPNFHLEKSDR